MVDDGLERDDAEGGSGFMMGLLTGTVLGAGLGMLLAPKSGSELRSQISEQASSLGRAAGEQIRRATEAAGNVVDEARQAAGRSAEDTEGEVAIGGESGGMAETTLPGPSGIGSDR